MLQRGETREGREEGEGAKRRRTRTEGDKENTAPARSVIYVCILLLWNVA